MANSVDVFMTTERLKECKGLQIIHLNIRSIFPKIDEIRNGFLTASMDVLCFTESWLNPQIADNLITIPGYSILRNDRPHKKGGGTCIYINHRLHFMDCLPNLSLPDVEIQSLMLTGNGNTSQSFRPMVIVLIYRPPQGNHTKALELIKQYINSISELSRKELVILGDLNWDYLEPNGSGWKNVYELELEFGVKQIITEATRYCRSRASLIDIILTNMNNLLMSGCLDSSISDHYPIFLIKKR